MLPGVALVLLFAACAARPALTITDISARGEESDFLPIIFDTGSFRLFGLLRDGGGGGSPLVVYLEGDGRVVQANGSLSQDPTPTRALGFELALQDPAPRVLYLARIGQYLPEHTGERYQTYWLEERLGVTVLLAADRALDQALEATGARGLHLVGYSGGGGLAALLAQHRKDVLSLVSVAGLLDTDYWTEHHGLVPLTGLNPADRASTLAALPQLVFVAKEDRVVPPAVAESYKRSADFADLRLILVSGSHSSHWAVLWPRLLREQVQPLRDRLAVPSPLPPGS